VTLIRTPEERFEDLPGYDYEAEYVSVGEPEMAYVDVGDPDADETFLCLHGEPTWGYLYRKMIPTLRERGRVVVPDMVGFGRSEKYTDPETYTFGMHYDALTAFVEKLDLENVTLVCQDWGGVLGLPMATLEHPERFARLVPMNTGTPTGSGGMIPAWWAFREYMADTDDPPIATVVRALGDVAHHAALDDQPEPWVAPVEQGEAGMDLAPEVAAAYDAPFHTPEAKAGAKKWPSLVATDPEMAGADVGQEAAAALAEWEKPAFVLFGDEDPITGPTRDAMRDLIPTADEQPDVWVEGAGHFLQEDAGEDVAEHIVSFVDRT